MGQVAEWVWAAGARAAAAAAAAAAGPALQQEVRDAVAGGRAGRGAARPGRSRWAQDGRLLPAAAGERGQPPSPAPIPARRRPAHSIQIECSVGQLRSKMAPAFLPPANTEARFKRDRSSLPLCNPLFPQTPAQGAFVGACAAERDPNLLRSQLEPWGTFMLRQRLVTDFGQVRGQNTAPPAPREGKTRKHSPARRARAAFGMQRVFQNQFQLSGFKDP